MNLYTYDVNVPYSKLDFERIIAEVERTSYEAKVVLVEVDDQAIAFILPKARDYFYSVGMYAGYGAPSMARSGHFITTYNDIPEGLKDVNTIAFGHINRVRKEAEKFLAEAKERHNRPKSFKVSVLG